MTKTKIMLSIKRELLEETKREFPDRNLSSIVEESLENLSSKVFFNRIFNLLNIEKEVISPKDVKKFRKKGFKSEAVIREMRDEGIS